MTKFVGVLKPLEINVYLFLIIYIFYDLLLKKILNCKGMLST